MKERHGSGHLSPRAEFVAAEAGIIYKRLDLHMADVMSARCKTTLVKIPRIAGSVFKRGGHSADLSRIQQHVAALKKLQVDEFQGFPVGVVDPRVRLKANLKMLQQVHLHRTIRLIVGSVSQFVDENLYGVALQARGIFESTAVLGFFCTKLENLSRKRIDRYEVEKSMYLAATGAKHELFDKAESPVNMMTCITRADEYLNEHFFKKKTDMILDCFGWLSEFSHPNFLSNQSAYRLKSDKFVFRHEGGLLEEDFQLPAYVILGAGLFTAVFDALGKRIDDGTIDSTPISGNPQDQNPSG